MTRTNNDDRKWAAYNSTFALWRGKRHCAFRQARASNPPQRKVAKRYRHLFGGNANMNFGIPFSFALLLIQT